MRQPYPPSPGARGPPHAPGAPRRHPVDEDGTPLVRGRKVTGLAHSEEQAVELTEVLPCLLEDVLTELGGHCSEGADGEPYVLRDGLLLTGRHPAPSVPRPTPCSNQTPCSHYSPRPTEPPLRVPTSGR